MGIATDGTRLLLADTCNNRVLVWTTLPPANVPTDLVLGRKNFTGNNSGTGRDQMNWPVNELRGDVRPWVIGGHRTDRPGVSVRFNGVAKALVAGGHLFVAEGFNRVHAWRRIEDACAGQRVGAILGQPDFDSIRPPTGRNRLHTPFALSFDGSYLWVGETKFSEGILRFSPAP